MTPPQNHPEIEALQRLHDAGLELQFLSDPSFSSQRTHLILSDSRHPVYEGAYRVNPATSLYVKETFRLQFPHFHLIPGRAGVRLSLDCREIVGERKASLLHDASEKDSPLHLGPRRLLQIADDNDNMYAYSIYSRWTHRFFEGFKHRPPIDTSHLDFQRRT